MGSYHDAVTKATLTADTAIDFDPITLTSGSGNYRIIKMYVGFGSVVDAKAATAIVEVKIDKYNGVCKLAVGHGNGGATSSSPGHSQEFDTDISVPANSKVTATITCNEAGVDGVFGITYVEA